MSPSTDPSQATGRYDPAEVARQLQRPLADQPQVRFAFLHGSVLDRPDAWDIDIGVWLEAAPADAFDAASELSAAFGRATGLPIDVQILNGAPVGVLHQVFRGRLVFARDWAEATDHVERVAWEHLVFSHHLADYLDAVTG